MNHGGSSLFVFLRRVFRPVGAKARLGWQEASSRNDRLLRIHVFRTGFCTGGVSNDRKKWQTAHSQRRRGLGFSHGFFGESDGFYIASFSISLSTSVVWDFSTIQSRVGGLM